MPRLILFILISALLFGFIFSFIHNVRSIEGKKPVKPKEEKHNSEYWWYNSPHYWIMSNGEQINLAEYITWQDWSDMGKTKKIEFVHQLENRILTTRKENKKEENYIE